MKFSEKIEKTEGLRDMSDLVSALLVAGRHRFGSIRSMDKRPVRFVQFNSIQLNEACRVSVKHRILWKFTLFPTFVEKMGLTNSFHLLNLMGLTNSFHLLNFGVIFQKMCSGVDISRQNSLETCLK